MLDKLGVPSTGKPTTSIADLETIKHPIAEWIVKARRLSHANKVSTVHGLFNRLFLGTS
jgi:hypothetical protein